MLPIGTILRNRYKIIKHLGDGGFGATYLAEDLNIPITPKPKCVVKHLRPQNSDPAVLELAKQLFEREANALYRLGNLHEQIPKLSEHFQENGEFYLVQEFIDGNDLDKEISAGSKLNEIEVLQLLREILEILAVVHNNNIIHRDIKPANIMRRQDGKIVLIDFGAVKEIKGLSISQGQVKSTITIGTPGFMPSEQAIGEARLCSDVYAIGMLGIYALTGIQPHQLPRDPNNGEVIWRNWANVNDKTAKVLDNMVRYRSGERYPTAVQALDAVTGLKVKQTIKRPQGTDISRRQSLKLLGGVGMGFGLAVVGGNLFKGVSQNNQPEVPKTPNIAPINSSPTASVQEIATAKDLSLQTLNFETVMVDAKGTINNRRKLDAKYLIEDLGNGITLEMLQIPGGNFSMGSPKNEVGRKDNENPQHQVKVTGFFMGRYLVTQEQYQAIMGNNPASFKGDKRPVESVSWDNAVEFCKKLSQKTGRNYRLPSEAEWEYACRAGTNTAFYFGETITTDLANYDGTKAGYGSAPKGIYRGETTEVGTFPPNAFGLYDMHGNVWEWCQDVGNYNYNGAPIDGSAWLTGKDIDTKLLRGGSWNLNPFYSRSAGRDFHTRVDNRSSHGFRLVLLP
ncbi:bifunctional serine/threonine-protein kinase/formylglycine-generating enzyme family protein [Calothrix sp. PCC 6303]|uniref:bifunctional serine/threonine-protein kinase/formylglycine-generating enzyme family protein n=1 Tax=Calothrix sp. PCC 6303 TaxID=1170562 RepID=UPI0002A03F24|nr:bifunctional serine/threonine-protein kinase/formylglycine-generating enzyme family protein [Calothrix sp. PCC 6303]AFZ00276.1 serine/threonine protein kinase [Calothrix sp. PCC 6303]